MKKIMTAIAATIIASTCIFFACSKEEENTVISVVCFVAKDAAEFGKLAKGGNTTHLRNGVFYLGIGVISIGTSASK